MFFIMSTFANQKGLNINPCDTPEKMLAILKHVFAQVWVHCTCAAGPVFAWSLCRTGVGRREVCVRARCPPRLLLDWEQPAASPSKKWRWKWTRQTLINKCYFKSNFLYLNSLLHSMIMRECPCWLISWSIRSCLRFLTSSWTVIQNNATLVQSQSEITNTNDFFLFFKQRTPQLLLTY